MSRELSLFRCPACGISVSSKAAECPQCGHRINSALTGWGAALVIIGTLYFCAYALFPVFVDTFRPGWALHAPGWFIFIHENPFYGILAVVLGLVLFLWGRDIETGDRL